MKKVSLLKLIKEVEPRKYGNKLYKFALFQCKCGNTIETSIKAVKCLQTLSCGCLRKNNAFKLPEGESSFNVLFYTYQKNAEQRKIAFNLEKDFFKLLTKQNCKYCGIKPSTTFKKPNFNGYYIYNGVDRIDNSIGYIKENVVTCCETCNRAKLAMPLDDFLNWIKKVYNVNF